MPLAPVGAALPAAAPPPVTPKASGFAAALEARGVAAAPRPPAPAAPEIPRPLASLERAHARLDAVLAAARSGRTFTAQELIGLQAEAYRATQVVDLGAKLAEQGATAVKQALNTQL